MSWYYRSEQPQYSFSHNYGLYYPSEHSTYPTHMSQYRGWRRTSPKNDYSDVKFGIDMANHRAEFGANVYNNDFGVRRAQLNADWESRVGKAWPVQPGLYQQETWGQWGLRDSRSRLGYEGAVDRIFSRY